MELNGNVKCQHCGCTDWTIEEDEELDYESDWINAKCNNCGEELFEKKSDIEKYAQRYDIRRRFLREGPCSNCGDIAWDEGNIYFTMEDDGDDYINAKCLTCGQWNKKKTQEISYGKPIHNKTYMHKNEFIKGFACPSCKRQGTWTDVEWGVGPFNYVYANCSFCGERFWGKIIELYDEAKAWELMSQFEKALEEHEERAPWDTKYYKHPCPYCGAMKVRDAKWSDKKLSVAFWGIFASRAGHKFICDDCKKSWE